MMTFSKLPRNSQPVSALRNLGPKSAKMLAEAGISTLAELRELGAEKAYVRVKSLRRRLVIHTHLPSSTRRVNWN